MSATTHPTVQAKSRNELDGMRLSFSYDSSRRHITEKYLTDAAPSGSAIHFDLDSFRPNISVLKLLDIAASRGEAPDVFAHVIDANALPRDLSRAPIPTASLDIDSFGWTASRVRWSMLFDYVFVWHLPLVSRYKEAGHPNVFALPHAVDARLFSLDGSEEDRSLDLGWVGGFGYGEHARRRRIVGALATRFKMNDVWNRCSKKETADIYRKSRIVVNVSRDDYPPDANMRCYEAMAGGALLMTQAPTELTDWGFREGEHFVGWREEAEIPDLIDFYLRHDKKRKEISRGGQELTLTDFTYQRCWERITGVLQSHPNQFFAPARKWSAEDVCLIHLEYYYRYQLLGSALEEFVALRKANPRGYLKGLPMILKTLRHGLKALV